MGDELPSPSPQVLKAQEKLEREEQARLERERIEFEEMLAETPDEPDEE